MILLIISLLNWLILKNSLLKITIALIIFIIAEVIRKKGSDSKAIIIAQIISALILVGNLIFIIINLIAK